MRLFLCEKPSQARDIAAVLGARQRGEGCLLGAGVTVTWCIGHLLETAAPDAYDPRFKRWNLADLPIIPTQWKLEVRRQGAAQLRVIRRLLKECRELVIATDADREGEMIAREVLDYCGYRGPILRLWLSALDEASIRRALAALRPGSETFNLYQSALGRSRADWLIGMNMSRLFTLLGQQQGYRGVLPVGRVQTPTLRLVVERDRSIAAFVPVPWWSIHVLLQDGQGARFTADWQAPEARCDEQGRCLDQALARSAAADLQSGEPAQVLSMDTERQREPAPLPFDLATLQQICSKKLGLGAQETLDIAQSLYERDKLITYPRSDCGYLPLSQHSEAPAILAALRAADTTLEALRPHLDAQRRSRAWNDAKVTAHHGIIPTAAAQGLARLTGKARAVYTLIRARYLAQFLPLHEFDRSEAQLRCAGHLLKAVGKCVVEIGWRRALPEALAAIPGRDVSEAQILPALQVGQRCPVETVQLKDQLTQPPRPYTEGNLIRAMKHVARLVEDPRLRQKLKDTTGIGTEATRAGIIQGLLERGYLQRQGKALQATPAGYALIDAVPRALADLGTTAIWEQALDMVQAGEMSLETFVDRQSVWMARQVERCRSVQLNISASEAPPAAVAKRRKPAKKPATQGARTSRTPGRRRGS